MAIKEVYFPNGVEVSPGEDALSVAFAEFEQGVTYEYHQGNYKINPINPESVPGNYSLTVFDQGTARVVEHPHPRSKSNPNDYQDTVESKLIVRELNQENPHLLITDLGPTEDLTFQEWRRLFSLLVWTN